MILYHGSNMDIKVIALVLFRQYENGVLTFENMVNGIIYKKTTNQYSFHTERSVSLLKKVGV